MKDLHQAHSALMAVMNGKSLARQQSARAAALALGVLREYYALRFVANQVLHTPLKAKHKDIEVAILIGLFQLRDARTPAHASVKKVVDLTRVLNKPWASKLVNAALRTYQRNAESIEAKLAGDEAATAHPRWMNELFRRDWPDAADQIVAANNEQGPLTLRVNTRMTSVDDYRQTLMDAGISATPCQWSDVGVRLDHGVSVADLPGFADGMATVQDEASQLAVTLLPEPQAGARTLDVCAAPGGKTTHLLERGHTVLAVDNDADRLGQLETNLARLHLSCEILCADGGRLNPTEQGYFDCILLDAPCSASGVIRRHPDIKLLRQQGDIAKLAAQQGEILDAVWQLLNPGGTLLYTTCSIFKDENERVIEDMLSRTNDAQISLVDVPWGMPRPTGRQLLPVTGAHDGFFYARLTKRPL